MSAATNGTRIEPWSVVFALGVTQITAWGSIYYLFSLLMLPLQRDLGADKSVIVGAFSGALLISGLLAPSVGALIDRRGGRSLMAAGSLLGATGLAALSFVSGPIGLYLVWALLGVAMSATLYEPAFAVITRAFPLNYRRAITALTLFGGFASTVFWPFTQSLIDGLGWRDAVRILALLNLVLCVPLHLWVLPAGGRPPATAAVSTVPSRALREVMRDKVFYLLAAAFTANMLTFSAMAVHMIAMLGAKGMSPAQAALFGALIGPMQVVGRLLEMGVGRRFAAHRVGMVAMALLPLSLGLFLVAEGSAWTFVLFASLYGAGNGIVTIVRGAIPVELFGRDHYGAINGALAAPVLAAKAAGPLVASLVWTLTGGYDQVIGVLAAVALGAVAFLGWASNAARRRPSASAR